VVSPWYEFSNVFATVAPEQENSAITQLEKAV
jgi:hypothetical protein